MDIKVKELRAKVGLTQEDFAHLLGVTTVTIHNWESGKTKPSRMARKLLEEIEKKENK